MKQIRIGLVGYGLSGSVFHAPLINVVPGLALSKVVSGSPGKVQRDYPGMEVVDSIDRLLGDPTIDAIVVASPNETHYDYAKRALEMGKHVIVEKPFANSSAEAQMLIDLAAKQGLLLSVYQNRRWDNDFLTVQKCIAEGLLGEVRIFEAHYDMYRPLVSPKWKEHPGAGTGALFDLGPHLIDQALVLFGMPTTISADIALQRQGAEVDDYFHLVLGYDTVKVILQSSSLVKNPGPHFLVHGTKGSLLKYGMDPQQGDLTRGLRPNQPGWGQDKPEWYAELTVGTDITANSRVQTLPGCYQKYYQGIYEALNVGAKPPVGAEEARDVIRLIELARRSYEEQRVVTVE